ncbi:MAG: hypothetical protein LAT63_16935 [Marinobacter sp.]|nr:hypothetical protein [Marinobacter sp.]
MASYGSRPFQEQLDFFRSKVSLPTRTWRDIEGASHARAFVVAGAMRDDLVADLRQAVDKAIEHGTTLAEFRRDFADIVKTRGWTGWTGSGTAAGEAWRTRTIYQTNLRSSYHAGRYKQMKAVAQSRPYWRYRHSGNAANPRERHLAWNGMVLRHDDPWWSFHYPPNDFGCGCFVESVSQRELEAMGKTGPDPAPTAPDNTDAVGEGFRHNIGEAAWGRPVSERAWAAANERRWESMARDDWRSLGLPDALPVDRVNVPTGRQISGRENLIAAVKDAIGGVDERVYTVATGSFNYPLLINAETLGSHLGQDRSRFIPLISEVLNNPAEVWATFERSRESGRVALRVRILKAVQTGRDRGVMAVMEAVGGQLVGWTFLTTDPKRLNAKRQGKILYQRP